MWGSEWGRLVWSSGAVAEVPVGAWALVLLGFLLGVFAMRARTARANLLVLLLAFFLVPTIATKATGMLPYTFTNGTVADANQVNANFNHLDDRVSALSSEFPVWVDSNGKVIGRASDAGYEALRRIGSEWFMLRGLSEDGFSPVIYFPTFATDDCSGTRYAISPLPIRGVFLDENESPVSVSKEISSISAKSFLNDGVCSTSAEPAQYQVREVISAPIDLTTEFTPPFQLR